MINKKQKKTIIITGASSGLGKALALEYSKLGYRLFLAGRSENRLIEITDKCFKNSGEAFYKILDVRNKDAMNLWIKSIAQEHKIDFVIANAGISAGSSGEVESSSQVYNIIDTNFYGVLNTILPSIEIMTKQSYGQIAIISSIAGLLPLPGAASYSTSKSALITLGDALRVELKQYKIKINIVIPGFIKTPLTDKNNFPMPFMVSAEKAAQIIIKDLERNKNYIYFPKIFYFIVKIINLLPKIILDYLLSKLPSKNALKENV